MQKLPRPILLLLAALVVLAPAAGAYDPDPQDSPLWAEDLPAGAVLEIEDVDADGQVDLFLFATVFDQLECRIYSGGALPGPGTLLASFPVTATSTPGDLVLAGSPGDLDGSGEADLLFYGTSPERMAVITDFRSHPSSIPVDVPLQSAFFGHVERAGRYGALDFDGDGYDDALFRGHLLVGGPGPTWTSVPLGELPLGGTVRAMLVPDFDGDDAPDIVMVTVEPGFLVPRFYVFSGGPGADLVADTVVELTGSVTGVFDIAWLDDFDADGYPEAAVLSPGVDSYSLRRKVAIFRGGPAFDATADYLFNEGAAPDLKLHRFGDAGDLDGDGHGDLLIGSRDQWPLVWFGGPGADLLPDALAFAQDFFVGWRPSALADLDGDGMRDLAANPASWQIFGVHEIDLNEDGIHDPDQMELFEDCNANGMPDPFDTLLYDLPGAAGHIDCDGNGRIDACEVAEEPSLDCNGNGIFDRCENGDCDGNDLLDACEIAANPDLDFNGDGALDLCQLTDPFFNCNGNTLLDARELAPQWTWIDCDGNWRFDSCEIADGSAPDADLNGRPDLCDGPLKLSVSLDPDGKIRDGDLDLASPIQVYVVLEATGAVTPSSVDRISFAVTNETPEFFLYDPQLLVPGSTDVTFGDPLEFTLTFDLAPRVDEGPVALVRFTGLLTAPRENVEVGLSGLVGAPGSPEEPAVPYWRDSLSNAVMMSSFNPLWLNRSWGDCNGNGVDDALEVQLGWEADTNGDLIPDVCQPVAAPEPPAPRPCVTARPNPFNPRTTIHFAIAEPGPVRLGIYDLNGRLVRTLVEQSFDAGPHQRVWDGRDAEGRSVASGVYVYRLEGPDGAFNGKLALVR